MENRMGMIIVLVLIGGFLIRHLFWGLFLYFFEKQIQAIKKISIRRFFQTIKLDFSHYYIVCLWVLGSILFLFEMFIALILFAIVNPLYIHKKIKNFLKNVQEIPETVETYNCY